ncbi:polysaccharide deacetylase family protein [Carboxylicivirga taeanensis]|uniref:polysaccharide deacetylase family protein n=1 Tax=Carboxylicivirga taeanensis TaxID=1416875 RepID=UPI003F6E260C
MGKRLLKELVIKNILRFSRRGLVYFGHGVCNSFKDKNIELLHLPADDLINVIEFWKRMGVDFISMEQLLVKSRQNFASSRPWIHFTFDDGYHNNLSTLLPIMERYNIPFTVFASTGLIEQNRRMPTYLIRTAIIHTRKQFNHHLLQLNGNESYGKRLRYAQRLIDTYKQMTFAEGVELLSFIQQLLTHEEWVHYNQLYDNDRLLTVDELKQLGQHPLVTLGAHGYYHVILHQYQSEEIIRQELLKPLDYLDGNLLTHAYPNGRKQDYTVQSKTMVKEMGYQLSFTTEDSFVTPHTSFMDLPRLSLTPKGGGVAKKWIAHMLP